jgi:hypothetical protein
MSNIFENTNIFDHFTPVIFSPGHMGTFLLNFLTAEKSTYLNKVGHNEKPFRNYSGEWQYTDGLGGFIGNRENNFDKIYDKLSKLYSGNILYNAVAISILNINWAHIQRGLNYRTYDWKEEIVDLILNNPESLSVQMPIEMISTCWSPYMKCHANQDCLKIIKNIKFKSKKIFCSFKFERAWLADIIHMYKMNDYYIKQNRMIKEVFLGSSYEMQQMAVKKIKESLEPGIYYQTALSIKDYNRFYYQQDFKTNYVDFDMYNLVFNKNIDQIYEIDPTFEFTDNKKNMLNKTNEMTKEIFDYYEIDCTHTIDHLTRTEEVLAMGKLSTSGFVIPS